ncbi:hypothetical protein [Acetobacterium tundrae]|uniref:hypothetical protein n=1 Tax=Acetobacterium tundrae TaxID=132932 RepID=UPI003B5CD184
MNVYAYLNHLLLYMPDADYQNDPEVLDVFCKGKFLPWGKKYLQKTLLMLHNIRILFTSTI